MNRGAQKLARCCPNRGDQTKLAAVLDIDQGYINRLVRGVKVPGLGVRRKFREHLGIATDAWDQKPAPSKRP
jgi:transcriptional regulator with XRE-family HTH domain